MEAVKGEELTDEELKLIKSMESKKATKTTSKVTKSDFSLNMPEFSFNYELDFLLYEKDTTTNKDEENTANLNLSKYHKENTVQSTSMFSDLDFGFGEYDAKQMVKFEYESVLDNTVVEVVHQFDPKKISHLDFEAGVLRICTKCNKSIEMRDVISSFGKLYHKKCLSCKKCGLNFTSVEPMDGEDGSTYCENDYYQIFAEKCFKCSLPIREVPVNGKKKKKISSQKKKIQFLKNK